MFIIQTLIFEWRVCLAGTQCRGVIDTPILFAVARQLLDNCGFWGLRLLPGVTAPWPEVKRDFTLEFSRSGLATARQSLALGNLTPYLGFGNMLNT